MLAKVVSWAGEDFASGLIMLLDARCDDAVADLLVRDAGDNAAAFDLLVRAWDLLSSDNDQDRVAELTAGWSVQRDLGRIDALTLARVWEPIVHKVFSGSPEAVFISAMTPETRADTLQYVMSRSAAPHVNGFAFGTAAFPVEETHPRENLHRDT
ncbi:hypothetical protein ACIBO1_32265 [Micromonospora sp. NPDC049903]|uniref:hypothetical protein n=1 Tax=Micromonospora sp. NPDC049903 TaxID=3364276 RepID=UPI0037ADA454